ncbi:unnamed protein product [Rhizoctonia solani]|uniref:Fungal-type protein kinase domain-containing protein n=1 Tax=Rhizoctonia solani TaxID=456999 RepID=A0A8H2XNS2_9AGAM|nr:unnamed protein product [Rhizoctonia solani]
MGAVLDAVLGYWRIFNLGYIHRDISDGNIMILQPDQAFIRREWKEPVTELSDIEDEDIRDSEQKLREVVASLNRDPIGMLLDFNLCVEHSGKEPVESKSEIEFHGSRKRMSGIFDVGSRKRQRPNITKCYAYRESSEPLSDCEAEAPVIEYRTGTIPFMATGVLGSTFSKPYRHSYLDDLESFFWLIYTGAVYHVDRGQDSNIYQRREFEFLINPDMTTAAKHKVQLVDRIDRMLSSLDRYDNSWAKSHTFRHVLSELRDFFRDVWNKEDPGMTPVEAFTRVTDILLDVAQ